MRRVQRSSILSNVSLRASKQEERIINAIDNHNRKERREQTPASEPKSRQAVHSWSL